MHRSVARAMLAVALAALGSSVVPAASKTTSTLPPGNADAVAFKRARLLGAHGEPAFALAALDGHDFERGGPAALLGARLLVETGRPAAAESLLSAEAGTPALAEDHVRARLVRARLLLDAKRYAAALDVISTVDTSSASPYRAYLDLVAARARVASGNPAGALDALERSHARAPEAIRNDLDALRVDVYRALERPNDALAAASAAARGGADSAAYLKLLEVRFQLASDAGDVDAAAGAARELFANHRRSNEAHACAAALARDREASRFDSETLLACAAVLRDARQRDALRAVLRRLDGQALSTAQGEAHRLLWGEYHFMNGDYSRAIALARPSYADPSLRRRSMLVMARSYKRVGRTADAATTYEAYARVFPNDAMAAEALYAAAALHAEQGREGEETRVLDQLRRAYPSTFYGWAASVARARALEASGDFADAFAIFDQWLARSRRTDEAALFYASRLRRAMGDAPGGDALLAELRVVNPYSFYARPDLAAAGNDGAPASSAGSLHAWLSAAAEKRADAFERVRPRVATSSGGTPTPEAARSIERARFFLAVGLRDWAERELDVARGRADGAAECLELARVFDDYAMPWRSVRLYEKARAGVPWRERAQSAEDFRYLTHPVPYPVQVVTAAGREGIAPGVLYGMMREESCFDADVVSRAGAVGLMQLMPETARSVARRLDLAPEAGDRLGDPVVNVSIGTWYAADLLREGEGSVVWMLAAYNAGPGAADRWIERGARGAEAVDAVESIDYRETRGYVKRVVEAANVYQALYFEGGLPESGPR
jgi:soluble lytic murein transglycosylase